MRRSVLLILASAVTVACGDTRLSQVIGDVLVEPARVDFSQVYVGHPVSKSVTLSNRSRAERTVQLSVEPPFAIDGDASRVLAAGETVQVGLIFAPDRAESFEGSLRVTVESEQLDVALTGSAVLEPDCHPSSPCQQSAFDPQSGQCVELPLPEGTECTSSSPCLTNTHCLQGECIGDAVDCDDDNVCTADACDPALGCIHQEDADACDAPSDPCKIAFCDPNTGCGVADAVDGTSCGKADCETAEVCIAGACKVLAVPEGAQCGADSPCQPKGVCQNKICVRPPSTVLSPAWTYRSGAPMLHFFGAVDANENLYWSECRSPPSCTGPGCPSQCRVVSSTRDGVIRWRVDALGSADFGTAVSQQLVAGPAIISFISNSVVEARQLSDGALLWSRDFPDEFWHSAWTASGFFGRPSADATQLVVPYEGWQGSADGPKLTAFAIAFDLQTGAVRWNVPIAGSAAKAAIDAAGNVYILSQPQEPDGVPQQYALESWTSQGTSRWSIAVASGGGLSVADGTVVLDGATAYDAANGSLRWSTPGSTESSPLIAAGSTWAMTPSRLTRRSLQSGTLEWSHPASQSDSFLGDAMVTDQSDVLLLAARRDATGRATPWLEQVKAKGDDGFACELPAYAVRLPNISMLLDGRWVGVLNYNQDAELAVFDLPGVRLAKKGWVAPRADQSNSARAR